MAFRTSNLEIAAFAIIASSIFLAPANHLNRTWWRTRTPLGMR
jgi:hypothetical protein